MSNPQASAGILRRDSTLFGVVDDTTTTKFTGRACAVQCNSLPVVVDQAVVVVLKFPIEPVRTAVLFSPQKKQNKVNHRSRLPLVRELQYPASNGVKLRLDRACQNHTREPLTHCENNNSDPTLVGRNHENKPQRLATNF